MLFHLWAKSVANLPIKICAFIRVVKMICCAVVFWSCIFCMLCALCTDHISELLWGKVLALLLAAFFNQIQITLLLL